MRKNRQTNGKWGQTELKKYSILLEREIKLCHLIFNWQICSFAYSTKRNLRYTTIGTLTHLHIGTLIYLHIT
jgi:hypothetical protein